MEDARMQAISGALQMAGGIILLLVWEIVFCAIMLARAFALLSFGARWVGDFGLSQMLLGR
jgi:hypothetical protein